MALAAGRLRSRAAIFRATMTDDGYGGQDKGWGEVATVWAEAISQNGREAVIAGALQGVSAMRISMRFRTDVTTSDQLELNGRRWNIRSAEDPDGRREQLVIFADTASTEA